MVMIPLSRRLENMGLHRVLATLACLVLLVAIFSGLIALLSSQVASFSKDMALIENRVNEQLEAGQRFIEQKVGISYESQEEMIKEQNNGKSPIHRIAARWIGSFTKLMVNGMLVLVYMFFFIIYCTRFQNFLLKLI